MCVYFCMFMWLGILTLPRWSIISCVLRIAICCMCVCVCLCMYIFMYVCMYKCMHVCLCGRESCLCLGSQTLHVCCGSQWIAIFCMCVCVCVCACVCVCVCVFGYLDSPWILDWLHMCSSCDLLYAHVCVYVCLYM
jgi:hypothetical protein